MEDKEVIRHLFEMEKLAEDFIEDAKLRAEQLVSEARSAAESKIKFESEKIVDSLEKNFQKCCSEADEIRAKEIENWKNALANLPVEKPAAKRLLREIILEGK